MADKKIDFSGDGKGKSATVEAVRNIPLSMLAGESLPKHLARHPGGARVEKGTELTVSADGAKYLKEVGYAK